MENKTYWKGLEELHQTSSFLATKDKEFSEELPVEEIFNENLVGKSKSRRDFLKMMGFSVSAAAIAASCRIPVKEAIPFVIKPEEVTPGVANYYASTFSDGADYCSILVKVRDGRPIKIEGNKFSTVTKGGTSARAQGSILSLYDKYRLQNPTVGGKNASWEVVDKEIADQLSAVKAKGGKIKILSSSVNSPSTKQLIADFGTYFGNCELIQWEPISVSAIAAANEKSFGKKIIPSYNFANAWSVVGFGCDFLGTWISPIEFTKQYVKNRKITHDNPVMSKHFHFESRLSLTGSNADVRRVVKPSQEGLAIISLYNKIASKAGASTLSGGSLDSATEKILDEAANHLWDNKGKSLVVCGSNSVSNQTVVNGINNLLGNYGSTIDLGSSINLNQGSDADVNRLVDEMNNGGVDVLMIANCNPVYDHPNGKAFAEALKKVGTTISFNSHADETGSVCKYACPDNHYLESWNDAEPVSGMYSICQPTIVNIFKTRQMQDSMLMWIGNANGYYSYIQKNWKQNIFTKQSTEGNFQSFWDNSVRNGIFETSTHATGGTFTGDLGSAANDIASVAGGSKGVEVVFYEKVGMGNGKYANNPWLQELPDPVSKITWDNYLSVSYKMANDELHVVDGDIVTLKVGSNSVDLPVLVQPGQADGTASVAVGYGRTMAGRAGSSVGVNVYPMIPVVNGMMQYFASSASISKTGKNIQFAQTQTHNTIEGRAILQETTLDEYKKDPMAGNEERAEYEEFKTTLYPKREYNGIKWGMSIDLNSCTGCGACVIGCQSENNVPVVGKSEVIRVHEMSWMRIDRYYSFSNNGGERVTEEGKYNTIADYQHVNVTFQPMLCQHCTNAPCENVCPVSATNHSSEGLNQMAYNRCIGTRYCANNCPYKVRRFNWLDYTAADSFPANEPWKDPIRPFGNPEMTDDLTRMVLNPDVTVRTRGVMEKCSFCVQRIQDAKLLAKKEDRVMVDGDVMTACQTACPADAITFGNILDEKSGVAKDFENERTFFVLAELNTQPSIGYMTKIRNTETIA